MSGPGFDRLPRRSGDPSGTPSAGAVGDPQGKRALFSVDRPVAGPGGVTVDCSACGERTALTAAQALRAMVPSVHLPLLRRDHPSWMRCPACGERTWVRVRIRL